MEEVEIPDCIHVTLDSTICDCSCLDGECTEDYTGK